MTERPRFRRPTRATPTAESPELLFGLLPRRPQGVPALWSHQADMLRTYSAEHRTTDDVALELPTGSGKTLVGLLIAEWRRRALRQRVAYVCPTQQLAGQVTASAAAQGIEVALLTGSHHEWPSQMWSLYTRAEAIAVTTYSTIFNSNPYLDDAQSLVLDDAHAGEQYAAGTWSLTIPSSSDLYGDLLDAVRQHLDPQLASRLSGEISDPREVHLLPIASVNASRVDIDRVLAAGVAGTDLRFAYSMLRPGLPSCLFYLSSREWHIRPMVPPTFTHRAFVDAEQRVYLSATLGESGELERSFGRGTIARVPVPPAWERTGSGRRFFVFPALANAVDGDGDALLRDLTALSPKQLLLTPSEAAVTRLANDTLKISADHRFDAKDGTVGIRPFLDADAGALLAANRYDGMDLKDDACHLEVLSGLPQATHLQDQFLATRLRATSVLTERIRTRVMQGAGRCVRGPQDWAVVVVHGDELLRFLERSEVQRSLPAELQTEVAFGLDQSSGTSGSDLVDLARSALDRDDRWQEAEAFLAESRQDANRVPLPDAASLASSAPREVAAWQAAWVGDWDIAANAAIAVHERLPGEGLRGFRSLWAYLSSAWSALAADRGVPGAAERSAHLLHIARQTARPATWLREIQPEAVGPDPSAAGDDAAAHQVLQLLGGQLKSAARFDKRSEALLSGLNQTAHTPYELALVDLGLLLGAKSWKPDVQGRADAVWQWEALWATVEAKSEQEAEGAISFDYVRQANTQLDSLAGDLGLDIPDGSFSVLVSPRQVVEPAAVSGARDHLYLATPSLMLDLAHDAVRAWTEIRGMKGVAGKDDTAAVAFVMWRWRVQPSQVRERLTQAAVRG